MSDGPRDQEPDGGFGSDEPTTGPPAGAASTSFFDPDNPASPASGGPTAAASSSDPGAGSAASSTRSTSAPASTSTGASAGATNVTGGTGAGSAYRSTRASGTSAGTPAGTSSGTSASTSAGTSAGTSTGTSAGVRATNPSRTRRAGTGTTPTGESEAEAKKRRKRRLLVAGISVAAALVVIALCAGGLAVLRAVSGFRDDAADAREDRRLRDTACLELETRLNRLTPPGATAIPQRRAVAVRDENAATRIYVGRLDEQRVSDGWRELLDSRTAYAEALDAQVKSRTPAFYVAPAPRDGVSLADQLTRWSPAACAGPIRRLAAPDL